MFRYTLVMANSNSAKPLPRLGRFGLLILVVCVPTFLVAQEVQHQRLDQALSSLWNRLLRRRTPDSDRDHPFALALFYSQRERQQITLEYHLPVVDEKVPLALAESGTPVNVRTPSGNTLLHEAVQFHHHTVVRYLVDNGSDIHAVDTHDSVPVLMGVTRRTRRS